MKKDLFLILILIVVIGAIVLVLGYLGLTKKSPEMTAQESLDIETLVLEQRCEEAIIQANALIRSDRNNLRAWQSRAVCEFDLGMFDDAKASFEKILGIDPNHEAATNYLNIMAEGQHTTSFASTFPEYFPEEIIPESSPLSLEVVSEAEKYDREEYRASITYGSQISRTQNISGFRSALEARGLEVSTEENSEATFVQAQGGSEQISVSIWKRSPVQVSLIYIKLKQ